MMPIKKGSTLSIAYDPYGIALTYTGYAFLLLSFILFFFDKHSYFRKLLNHPALKKITVCILLSTSVITMFGASVPPSLPKETANEFGKLYVYYNDRICRFRHWQKSLQPNFTANPITRD